MEYKSEDIKNMISEVMSGVKTKDIDAGDPDAIASSIISEMAPKRLSTTLINAAHGMDMKFSIDSMSGAGVSTLANTFRAKLEAYNKEMEKMSKLKLMDNLNTQLEEISKKMAEGLKKYDKGNGDGLADMYREDNFSISRTYSRDVVAESYVTGDKMKTQSISAYKLYGDYDPEYELIREDEISRVDNYEIEMYFKKAMKVMQRNLDKKTEEVKEHIGTSPDFNDEGKKTDSGKGEKGRLIGAYVNFKKELIEGESKKYQPVYKKNITEDVPVTLDTIGKIGLSFLPGKGKGVKS